MCHSHDHWFAVHRNPNPIHNNLLQLAPVPRIPTETGIRGSAYAAVGPKIYVLGGCTDSEGDEPSSEVWVLDCRSHTWERGPSMRFPRYNAEAIAVDGEVYVVGGFPAMPWVEVLDPAVGRWEAIPIPIPSPDTTEAYFYALELVDGKISFMFLGNEDDKQFRLDPTTKTWEVLLDDKPYKRGICVVDGVSYRLLHGMKFERFDKRVGMWKELKHVEQGKPKYLWGPKLLNLKGRLVMVFEEVTNDSEMGNKIGLWSVEINVMKNDGDWCGQTHWSEKVLLLPHLKFHSEFYFLCSCLSASL